MNGRFILAMGWYYGFYSILRGPSYVVASLSMPMTMLFLVYMLSRGHLIAYAILGGYISMVSTNALSSAGDAAFFRLELKIQDLFVASSVSPTDYMLGIMLSYLVFSAPGIAVYAILSYIYRVLNLTSALVLIAVIILMIISTGSLSFIVAGMMKHIRNVWGIVSILSIVLSVIPPIFYPYTYLPRYALYALSFSPATPAAVIMQGVAGLQPMQPIMLAILLAETAVYFALARKFIRWTEV